MYLFELVFLFFRMYTQEWNCSDTGVSEASGCRCAGLSVRHSSLWRAEWWSNMVKSMLHHHTAPGVDTDPATPALGYASLPNLGFLLGKWAVSYARVH